MSEPKGELRTALKEWEILTHAMGRGEIVAMVRKGGIREQRAGFVVRHDQFLLYPTWFHEKQGDLAERFRGRLDAAEVPRPAEGTIRIEFVCDVVGLWRVEQLDRLDGISHEHGLSPNAVASRFHYRNEPGVQVVVARVSRLPLPVDIPEAKRYLGCVSWVALDQGIETAGAVPVLSDREFKRRVAVIEECLGPAGVPG